MVDGRCDLPCDRGQKLAVLLIIFLTRSFSSYGEEASKSSLHSDGDKKGSLDLFQLGFFLGREAQPVDSDHIFQEFNDGTAEFKLQAADVILQEAHR